MGMPAASVETRNRVTWVTSNCTMCKGKSVTIGCSFCRLLCRAGKPHSRKHTTNGLNVCLSSGPSHPSAPRWHTCGWSTANTNRTWSTFAIDGSASSLFLGTTSPTRPAIKSRLQRAMTSGVYTRMPTIGPRPSCQSMLTILTLSPTSTCCCIFFSNVFTLHSSTSCGAL